jgi:hypothetical protein
MNGSVRAQSGSFQDRARLWVVYATVFVCFGIFVP